MLKKNTHFKTNIPTYIAEFDRFTMYQYHTIHLPCLCPILVDLEVTLLHAKKFAPQELWNVDWQFTMMKTNPEVCTKVKKIKLYYF